MKKNKGFSLIELLVVISIIGVLTTVLVMNFVGSRERARDSQKIQSLNNLKNALRSYYNDNQQYPPDKTTITGTGFTGYVAGLGMSNFDFNFDYLSLNGGDGFLLKIPLEVGAGSDDINSQINCGVGATERYYAVCSN